MSTSLTEYHEQYTTWGWQQFPVFPINEDGACACSDPDCGSPGKHPIGMLAPNGLGDATVDRATLAQWRAVFPDANIGIRTGSQSGIVVVDVDPDKGGWDSVDLLEAEHGPIPPTPTVATGGGGAHVYFRHPGGMVPNSASKVAPGIDIRGDGGYVVAPPSGHVSGNVYVWAEGYSPSDVPLADLPAWLIPETTRRSDSPSLKEDELISQGGRNDRLMRIGAAFRRYGLTESEIAAALHAVNRTRCRPQLDEAEVGRIAASVARYDPDSKVRAIGRRRKAGGFRIVGGQVVAS